MKKITESAGEGGEHPSAGAREASKGDAIKAAGAATTARQFRALPKMNIRMPLEFMGAKQGDDACPKAVREGPRRGGGPNERKMRRRHEEGGNRSSGKRELGTEGVTQFEILQ